MTDDLDRIRAQYTGAHRCDPPGSAAADVRTLLAEIDRLRAALDGHEHDAGTINQLRPEHDQARRAAIAECIAAVQPWADAVEAHDGERWEGYRHGIGANRSA